LLVARGWVGVSQAHFVRGKMRAFEHLSGMILAGDNQASGLDSDSAVASTLLHARKNKFSLYSLPTAFPCVQKQYGKQGFTLDVD
jgi:hypothetical protein